MSKEIPRLTRGELFKGKTRDVLSGWLNFLKFEVEGRDNLEFMREGRPAIVAFFPHCGHPDSLAVRKAIPADLREFFFFAAKASYWHNKEKLEDRLRFLLGQLLIKNFPMSGADSNKGEIKEGVDIAEDYLRSGYSIAISPEGTRSLLPLEERKLEKGAADLVLRTNVPIVPVRLHGFEELMPRGFGVPRFFDGFQRREVVVSIGESMIFDLDAEAIPGVRRQQRELITAQLKERFLEM